MGVTWGGDRSLSGEWPSWSCAWDGPCGPGPGPSAPGALPLLSFQVSEPLGWGPVAVRIAGTLLARGASS